jgi:hypothetical protein
MPETPPLLSWPALHPRPRYKQYLVCSVISALLLALKSTDLSIVLMKVLRDGRWSEVESAILVPGDVISVKLGDIIPADARLLEGDPLKIDQVIANCRWPSYPNLFDFKSPSI